LQLEFTILDQCSRSRRHHSLKYYQYGRSPGLAPGRRQSCNGAAHHQARPQGDCGRGRPERPTGERGWAGHPRKRRDGGRRHQRQTRAAKGSLGRPGKRRYSQFEREVTGERIRDKIAASKRKGIWVGGNVPLGYESRDKKLVIHGEEAERIRLIFGR
jgi:hypothetical protein